MDKKFINWLLMINEPQSEKPRKNNTTNKRKKERNMKTLYKWQKIIIWIIGVLTFVAVTFNSFGKKFNIGYFLDLIIAIGMNILILWLLFKTGNWIYQTINNKNERKN